MLRAICSSADRRGETLVRPAWRGRLESMMESLRSRGVEVQRRAVARPPSTTMARCRDSASRPDTAQRSHTSSARRCIGRRSALRCHQQSSARGGPIPGAAQSLRSADPSGRLHVDSMCRTKPNPAFLAGIATTKQGRRPPVFASRCAPRAPPLREPQGLRRDGGSRNRCWLPGARRTIGGAAEAVARAAYPSFSVSSGTTLKASATRP